MEGAESITLARAQAGDSEAFQMLVEENSHKMFRLAYRMTGNEADAEDVVQETFLRAYRRLGAYESRAHFSSWLHRIAANYAIDLLRRRKRWQTDPVDATEQTSPLTGDDPGPESRAFASEIGIRVEAALTGLTAKERVAFTMRHFEGLSIKQIAAATDNNVNTTKNHIFRAVRKLRKILGPTVGDQR